MTSFPRQKSREALTSLRATSALTCEDSMGSRPCLCGISNDQLNGPLGIQSLVSKTDEPDVHQCHRSCCFRNPLCSRKAPREHLNPQGLFRAHEVSQGCQRVCSLGNCCAEAAGQRETDRSWPGKTGPSHPRRTIAKLLERTDSEFKGFFVIFIVLLEDIRWV